MRSASQAALSPGHLVDTFLGHTSCKADFDHYWKTRIGPVREYMEAAHAAGFETEQTSNFWLQIIAWS